MNEAQSLLAGGRFLESLGEYEHCIVEEPSYAAAWDGMAQTYESLGEFNKADRCRESANKIRAMIV